MVTVYRYNKITVGLKKRKKYVVLTRVYNGFLNTFKDRNPLHIQNAYARNKGYKAKVMHGAILNGFISHFVGTVFPGRNSLLHSVNISYKSPTYLHDKLQLKAKVIHKNNSFRVINLDVEIENLSTKMIAAKAQVQVGMIE